MYCTVLYCPGRTPSEHCSRPAVLSGFHFSSNCSHTVIKSHRCKCYSEDNGVHFKSTQEVKECEKNKGNKRGGR